MQKPAYALALILLASGCGDDDEADTQTLDCAWLADENNCWRQAVRAAESCVPAEGTSGTFDEARTTCTYEDGATVEFGAPLELPLPDEHLWDFSLSNGGETCVAFREHDEDHAEVTTPAGTVSVGIAGFSMVVTCADGTRFAGDGLQLLECKDAEGNVDLSGMPGHFSAGFDSSISFGLLGLGQDSLSVFSCSDPAPEL